MTKIFISYRREDSSGHTGRLYDSLSAHFGADSLFMDLSAIESGQNFVNAINAAVGSCDALIAVIGKQWLTCARPEGRRLDDPGDFVLAEIRSALERGTPVIPVLVEGAAMPSVEALPDVLKPLARRAAHELSDHRWSYDVGRLIEAIEKLAGVPRRSERRTWSSVAAAAGLVAILAGLFLFRPMLQSNGGLEDADAYYSRATDAERDARTRLAELGETAPSGRTGVTEPAGDTSSGPANVRLAGEWSAEVTYSWGGKYTERFSFELDGNDVLGTASFLGVRRGIREGTLNGDRLLFSITQGVFDGDNQKEVVHRYRGKISGDVIAFSILSEGGDSDVPVEFTARRER